MKQTQPNYPYFGMGSNNSVVALYVLHPELLAKDDPTQRGKPFLFYVGGRQEDVPAREIEEGFAGLRPYVGTKSELADILNGRTDKSYASWLGIDAAKKPFDKLPERVTINGEEVLRERLSSGWVPFSFGVRHEYDCQEFKRTNGGNVRLDFEKFKSVLAKFDARKAYEATVVYRVRRFFGVE